MATETWQMIDPRRAHPDHPVLDDESSVVLEEALHSLTMLRSPLEEGDAGARLHALASLAAQAEVALPDAVADARGQDYSWSEIARRLGIATATARRHFAHYARTRRLPFED